MLRRERHRGRMDTAEDASAFAPVAIEIMPGETPFMMKTIIELPEPAYRYLITTQAKRNLSSRSGIGGVRSAT